MPSTPRLLSSHILRPLPTFCLFILSCFRAQCSRPRLPHFTDCSSAQTTHSNRSIVTQSGRIPVPLPTRRDTSSLGRMAGGAASHRAAAVTSRRPPDRIIARALPLHTGRAAVSAPRQTRRRGLLFTDGTAALQTAFQARSPPPSPLRPAPSQSRTGRLPSTPNFVTSAAPFTGVCGVSAVPGRPK